MKRRSFFQTITAAFAAFFSLLFGDKAKAKQLPETNYTPYPAINIDGNEFQQLALMTAEQAREKALVHYHWSRAPGCFVDKETGEVKILNVPADIGPTWLSDFTGTVREWYDTLTETIVDASNKMFVKTFRNATKIYTSPDVTTLMEQSGLYKANYPGCPHFDDPKARGSLANRLLLYTINDNSIKRNEIILVDEYGNTGRLTVEHLNVV